MVSVILPIYGAFSRNMLRLSLESLKLQKDIALEVTVSCLEGDNDVESLCRNIGCRYASVPSSIGVVNGNFVPAAFRNAAASQSTGKYIYNADIDIIYLSRTYFAELVALAENRGYMGLYMPPMRRMPIDVVPEFVRTTSTEPLLAVLGNLDFSQSFLASMPGMPPPPTVVFRDNTHTGFIVRESASYSSLSDDGLSLAPNERILVYVAEDFAEYRSSPDNRGKEPFFCTQDIHCGSTLVDRRKFWAVGGFCLGYSAWGCHDADLQWKLRHTCSCGTTITRRV